MKELSTDTSISAARTPGLACTNGLFKLVAYPLTTITSPKHWAKFFCTNKCWNLWNHIFSWKDILWVVIKQQNSNMFLVQFCDVPILIIIFFFSFLHFSWPFHLYTTLYVMSYSSSTVKDVHALWINNGNNQLQFGISPSQNPME
jgi:hypothetical protein